MNDSNLKMIKNIIDKYINPVENKVFVFGSRSNNKASKFSDIDIGIEGNRLIPEIYFSIQGDLEESDLPYKVDLVEFLNVSDEFKKVAKSKIIPINF